MSNPPSSHPRIGYLDAMRGFAILLVVCWHNITWSYYAVVEEMHVFGNFFWHFLMPMFFFLSGWLFYKKERTWNLSTAWNVISHKFMQLMIPTAFFFAVFVYTIGTNHQDPWNPDKAGYWFTFSLFEYFVFYVFSMIINPFKNKGILEDVVVVVLALAVHIYAWFNELAIWESGGGIQYWLSLSYFTYYIFFVLGTLVKKYYDTVLKCFDNQYVMAVLVLLFAAFICYHYRTEYVPQKVLFVSFLVYSSLGCIITLAFFRKHEDKLSLDTKLGSWLQLLGRRTLDIYLIHYFFVSRKGLRFLGQLFTEIPHPVVEFAISVVIATLIIIVVLMVSELIRLSPFLAKYLLGARTK